MRATFILSEDEVRAAIHTYLKNRGFRGDRCDVGPELSRANAENGMIATYELKAGGIE